MGFKAGKLAVYLILLALIAVFAFIGLGLSQDNYSIQFEGVVFQSRDVPPTTIVPQLAAEKEFIVSMEIHDPVQASDSFMFNGLALFLVVLNGNSKETTQLLRVVDDTGNLSYCLTNYGDVRTEERLTVEQCNAMLNDDGKISVLINFPNTALAKPRVTLSNKRMVIESNSIEAVNNTSFTVLKAMFSNAEEVLIKSNRLTEQLG